MAPLVCHVHSYMGEPVLVAYRPASYYCMAYYTLYINGLAIPSLLQLYVAHDQFIIDYNTYIYVLCIRP